MDEAAQNFQSASAQGSAAAPGPEPIEDAGPPILTPMMVQFFAIKSQNPGYLLFYRMGDFYELFFEDAEIAAQALNIVLTRRGKHLGQDIRMCGVPVHAAPDYLRKLISLGHRVAVCEQVEDPAEAKKRGAKSVVKREVVRLVTRGTLTEDDLLPTRSSNYLAALAMLAHGQTDFALAWADISTGQSHLIELGADTLIDELARIDPVELVLTEATRQTLADRHLLAPNLLETLSIADPALFDSETASAALRTAFTSDDIDPTIWSRGARSALGALLAYVLESQKGKAPALRAPSTERQSEHMAIDQATRASLELLVTQKGLHKGSLRAAIDLTVTAPGSRLLAQRLSAPLCHAATINARLDDIEVLVEDPTLTAKLRSQLKSVPDLSRALTRISLERGGPRDLRSIGAAISAARQIGEALGPISAKTTSFHRLACAFDAAPHALAADLLCAIDDEPPLLARDGNFVRKTYDQTLDDERTLGSKTRVVVAALQARLIDETDVKSLKIKHNGVLGYFVEVPAGHGGKLLEEPFRQQFIHRQTLANAMRFTTTELAELEGRIARAHEAALQIEQSIFARLCADVLEKTHDLQQVADGLAELDVIAALAQLAATRNFCRPLVDNSLSFAIDAGRHPVVEEMVAAAGQSFVANDADLSGTEGSGGGKLWLVTGPNMGGKSTFLRQNAVIAILAQMGSFVPATHAHIGVIDRVFSRVGASDDIAHGRSTFMVEMIETAGILNKATNRSLVILDEIGRGTATFDGLSIAWAAVEALHDTTGCRALFATHFHELTSLQKTLNRVSNVTMKVREWKGEVVFLHEVGQGAADRSYGIAVAKLAGLPEPVLARARQVLTILEQRSAGERTSGNARAVLDDLPLFAHQPPPVLARADPVHTMLDAVRPDEMTPKQAIELVYELKKLRNVAR